MLTPQDVQNKEFAKAVFGGYDMSAVDNFLEIITEDYSALFKENAILKSKIKVLVEKVEEYRSTEDSMRMALLTAQKMGDDLIEEANRKSTAIVADAENKFKSRMEELSAAISAEEARLRKAKRTNEEFVIRSTELIKEHAGFLAALDTLEVFPEKEAPSETILFSEEKEPNKNTEDKKIDDAVRHIEEVMSKLIDDEEKEPRGKIEPLANESLSADDEDDELLTPRPKFDFQNLQFGKNYSPDGNQ